MPHSPALRLRLECGQSVYLGDLAVTGTIMAVWPVQEGSEARIRLDHTPEDPLGGEFINYHFGMAESRRQ